MLPGMSLKALRRCKRTNRNQIGRRAESGRGVLFPNCNPVSRSGGSVWESHEANHNAN